MSLAKSPVNNFGSGNTKLRAVVTTAAAALIGTLVGGASVLGIVTAVTQPPAHDIKTDAQHSGDGTVAPAPSGQAATTPPQTAPVVAERQSAPAAQSAPPAEGFRAVWPDALSARANHGAATPAPQQALPPANDRSALNQSEQYGTGREPYAADSAATARDSQPNQISPNTAPAKKRVVASPPGPSADRTVDEVSAGNASVGKTRSDARKSQSQQARQRSPDTSDQSGDGQAASVYPPQRRVIILPGPNQPGPNQAANDDRGHWGGGGGGLFDFFGQNHSDGDHWSQDHWNNDWHGSHDWHD